jgi:hypothetical protein
MSKSLLLTIQCPWHKMVYNVEEHIYCQNILPNQEFCDSAKTVLCGTHTLHLFAFLGPVITILHFEPAGRRS